MEQIQVKRGVIRIKVAKKQKEQYGTYQGKNVMK